MFLHSEYYLMVLCYLNVISMSNIFMYKHMPVSLLSMCVPYYDTYIQSYILWKVMTSCVHLYVPSAADL